jgi:hypothetical protein
MGRGSSPIEQVLLAGDAIAHLIADPNPDDAEHVERLEALDVPMDLLPNIMRATREYAAEVMGGLPG